MNINMDNGNKEGISSKEPKIAVPNVWFKPFIKAADIKSAQDADGFEEKRIVWTFKNDLQEHPLSISLVPVSLGNFRPDVPCELLDSDGFINIPGIRDWQQKNGSKLFTLHVQVEESEHVSNFPFAVAVRAAQDKEEIRARFAKDQAESYRATQYNWKDVQNRNVLPLVSLQNETRSGGIEMMLRREPLTVIRRVV